MQMENTINQRPNILWIVTDQHKATALSCIGERALKKDLTPNLDALAADGTLFTNAYCPSPVCGPSRASMITGKFPPENGMVTNVKTPLREDNFYLPQLIKEAGYETGMAGKLHLAPADKDYGFHVRHLSDAPYSVYADEDKYSEYIDWLRANYFDAKGIDPVEIFDRDELAYDDDLKLFMMGSCFRSEEEHETRWTTDRTIDFLNEQTPEKPFFFYTSYFGPHQPYGVPEPYASYYKPEDIELPESFYIELSERPELFQESAGGPYRHVRESLTEDDCKEVIAAYLNQVRMIDVYIGKIIDQLKANGQYENTMIIFTSDHGENLGDYGLFFKSQMYDSCAKVPLIIKPAGKINPQRRDEVVNTIDLFATMLDAAGADWKAAAESPDMESVSMIPLLSGEKAEWKNETYSIFGCNKDKALTMIREGKWKLVRLAHGEVDAVYELYNLEADPEEMQDVYAVPENSDIVKELKEKLDKWFRVQYHNFPQV